MASIREAPCNKERFSKKSLGIFEVLLCFFGYKHKHKQKIECFLLELKLKS